MKSRMKRPVRRTNHKSELIPCCYGNVYLIGTNELRIIADSADNILDRLRKIDGVEVVEFRGRWCDLKCPPLRLPDVTSVLVPLDSRLASSAPVIAAHRGRIW